MVSGVRHASGVEDSFLSWPPKGVEERFLKSNFASSCFLLQTKREKERGTKSEEYDRAEI